MFTFRQLEQRSQLRLAKAQAAHCVHEENEELHRMCRRLGAPATTVNIETQIFPLQCG